VLRRVRARRVRAEPTWERMRRRQGTHRLTRVEGERVHHQQELIGSKRPGYCDVMVRCELPPRTRTGAGGRKEDDWAEG